MRKLFTIIMLFVTLPAAWAGEAGTIYSELTFVDVASGQEAAFRQQAVEVIKPLAQQRIDDGDLFVWALYRVAYGAADYDHVLIRQAIKASALEPVTPIPEELWRSVHGRKDQARTLEALGSIATVRERTLYALAQFHTNLGQRDRPWLTTAYVRTRPGSGDAFDTQMDMTWKPVLANWVAEGPAAAFSRYKVAQPTPGGHWHDQVLVTQYSSFGDLLPNDSLRAAFAAAHPDGDVVAAEAAFRETAEVVRTEGWQLLELATRRPPPPAPAEGDASP